MSPSPNLGHLALWELATNGTCSNQLGDCILSPLDNTCYSLLVIQIIDTICIYWWGGIVQLEMKVKLTHPPTLRNRAASICCLSVSLFSMHTYIFLNIFDVALSRGGKKGWDPCLGR